MPNRNVTSPGFFAPPCICLTTLAPYSTVYAIQNHVSYAQLSRYGWLLPTCDLSALWSLYPPRPSCVFPPVVLWLSYACALLLPNQGALPMLNGILHPWSY